MGAPSHPLAKLARKRGVDLERAIAEHLQIVVEDPSALTAGRDFGVISSNTWRTGDMHSKLELICAGVGWGRLPGWLVRHVARKGANGARPISRASGFRLTRPPPTTFIMVTVAAPTLVMLRVQPLVTQGLTWTEFVTAFVGCVLGITFLAAALSNYFLRPMRMWGRLV